VKYDWADEDKGHNQGHKTFSTNGMALCKKQDLNEALAFVSQSNNILGGDFLHHWSHFYNKMTNLGSEFHQED
jgi:hypothetical protein